MPHIWPRHRHGGDGEEEKQFWCFGKRKVSISTVADGAQLTQGARRNASNADAQASTVWHVARSDHPMLPS